MKYQVDQLLYRAIPQSAHRWASENRARIRALVLAVGLLAAPFVTDGTIPPEVAGAVAAAAAVVTGEATHRVVSPWDQEDGDV